MLRIVAGALILAILVCVIGWITIPTMLQQEMPAARRAELEKGLRTCKEFSIGMAFLGTFAFLVYHYGLF